MSDQLLTLAKFGLLALLYVFFARTLWAVWSEVRSAAPAKGEAQSKQAQSKSSQSKSSQSKSRSGPAAKQAPVEMPPPAPAVAAAIAAANAVPSTAPSASGRPGAQTSGKNSPAASVEGLPEGKLVVVEPEAQHGIVWPLGRELTIGRAPGCGVPIDDTFVSQLHARVWAAGTSWMVEDLGSTNGTIFNGDALTEPRVMQMGDQIRVGSTVLELR